MRTLKDKPIVITGAGKTKLVGYGAQIAKNLHEEGAIIHLLGRTKKRLQNTKQWIGKTSKKIFIHECDIGNKKQVQKTFKKIQKQTGPIYGLINNAATNPSRNNIENTTHKEFKDTIKTNVQGPFNCIKEAIPQMIKRKEGSIVSITSIFAHVANQRQTSYATSKHALRGLTNAVGLQYCKKGINANCVAPGYALTDLTAPLLEKLNEKQKNSLLNSHAIRREIKPEEVAQATNYLLKAGPATTASTIHVSGGFLHNPPR